ncbi:hypothetical protein C8R47DRAFT_1084479 [Mycena vitilis]|nr:hypothetical protein C8R47DRAFT_1084479 [Mycena vitilis]
MDASQTTPAGDDTSIPREPAAVYGERNESGLYDAVANQIEGMGKDALANVDYPDDFTRRIEDWSKNHRFVDKAGNELRTAVVGEILGPAMGTIVRAHGNYFARDGDDFKPIDDKSKIKDTIALGIPTQSTVKLVNIFLKPITEASADEDSRMARVPSAAGAPKVKRTAKRKLDEVDADEGPSTKHEADKTSSLPVPEDIKLGAHYEAALLQDYGGSYFNHIKSKLVQLDIYQVNAHSIRVLSESEESVEERTRPIAPNSAERVTSKLPERPTISSFSNFVVPPVAAAPGSPHSTLSGEEVNHDEMTGVEETSKRRGGKRAKRD